MAKNNNLKQIRESLNITQHQLAKALGVTKQTIINYQKNLSNVSSGSIEALCKYLNTTYQELVENKELERIKSDREQEGQNLKEAIKLVESSLSDKFTKDDQLEIATELFYLLRQFNTVKESDNEAKEFLKELKNKYFAGLAAKCLLDQKEN